MKKRKNYYANMNLDTMNKDQLLKLLEQDSRRVIKSMKINKHPVPEWIEDWIMKNCEDLWTFTDSYTKLSSMIIFDNSIEEYRVNIDLNIMESVTESVLRKFLYTRKYLLKPEMFKNASPRIKAIWFEVQLRK